MWLLCLFRSLWAAVLLYSCWGGAAAWCCGNCCGSARWRLAVDWLLFHCSCCCCWGGKCSSCGSACCWPSRLDSWLQLVGLCLLKWKTTVYNFCFIFR
jgi:hypothetical protein